jgi:hypothetical protein
MILATLASGRADSTTESYDTAELLRPITLPLSSELGEHMFRFEAKVAVGVALWGGIELPGRPAPAQEPPAKTEPAKKEEPEQYRTVEAAAAQLRWSSRSLALKGSGVSKDALKESLQLVLKNGVNADGLKISTEHFSKLAAKSDATADEKTLAAAISPYLSALKAEVEKEGKNGIPTGFGRNCALDTVKLLNAPELPRLPRK